MDKKTPSTGQRDYEARRAAKAGVSLDKWLAQKAREAQGEAQAKQKSAEPPKPPKPPGLLKRLIDRAHQPLAPQPGKPAARQGVKAPAAPPPRARRRSSP